MQYSNKGMLELAQQIKKTDSDDYVFNHQWFRITYIILRNLHNTNSIILPTKTPPGNPITDYLKKKKKKIKKKNNSKYFWRHLLGILVRFS